jgi:hypothetical protein
MSRWQQEMLAISKKHGGLLRPVDVVAFAKNPKTALHSKFTWDDTEAAEQYRLWEARKLITVSVAKVEGLNKAFNVYVSLESDRDKPGGGYRSLVSVMGNVNRRQALLDQSFAELERWREKYESLTELLPIFQAMDGIKRKSRSRVQAGTAAGV